MSAVTYASFIFAVGGKSAAVGTVPITLIAAPGKPEYPEIPE